MTSNPKRKEWKKTNEPITCYDCGSKACAQADLGHGVHWYCFVCLMENSNDMEYEEDSNLQVCLEQLELQSARYS